ncbi:DUF3472 domain-containing protein [Rubripirellula reticaptiva]|nr:fibronectin type III domain-containing protein [Rubripirellula reticaptiva]
MSRFTYDKRSLQTQYSFFCSAMVSLVWAFTCATVTAQEPGATASDVVPQGMGQLESAPTLFAAGVDDSGREYFLNGQPAKQGKLILTASNGFFDHGVCRADGESSLPKVGDEDLIQPNFAFLRHWKRTDGTIRWHVWISQPGKVRLDVNMQVANASAGSEIKVSFAGQSRTVRTVESKLAQPQPWDLVFEVAEPGEHTIEFKATQIADPKSGVGELHTIDVHGPAINDAQLLRARWRPAAVHGGYYCSTIKQSRVWVMATRSLCDFSSYSPITTPFGYFGTSFDANRRSNGNLNFSMWAARSRGSVPPLHQMPHLLAAGSPEAEFSGFGHEGSGVKLRGWTPMVDRPEVVVQALRVVTDGVYDTYHGHFWDRPNHRWKLYAVGRKWHGGKPKQHLAPGSFCEVPGPPHIQRSGDLVREVRRRGWHFGDDKQWHAMDTFECKSKGPANKFWQTTSDGEFAMATGGMRYYEFETPRKLDRESPLPEFLSAVATQQLVQLPADLGESKAVEVLQSTALINIGVQRAGVNARAEIYYSETDCLTFAKRKLHGTERNSAVSKSTQGDERSWQQSVSIHPINNGNNSVALTNLKPKTTYYCRVLITNDEGKVWSFNTLTFRTK